MWFRVFGTREEAPAPAALLEALRVEGHFKGDDLGWFGVDFVLASGGDDLHLDRFLAEEDEIRDQLNAWAAWLETQDDSPYSRRLMQLMIGAQQLFTLDCPRDRIEEPPVQEFCQTLCRHLAKETQGVYQIDGRGFFSPDGKMLVLEE